MGAITQHTPHAPTLYTFLIPLSGVSKGGAEGAVAPIEIVVNGLSIIILIGGRDSGLRSCPRHRIS